MTGHLIHCLLTDIPVSAFIDQIEAEPELWRENTWRQDYVVGGARPISPQQDTEALMFLWAPENRIESVRDSLDIVEHPNFKKFTALKTLLGICLARIEAVELGRVFVAKLKPNGQVIPHADYGKYADHFERFHLVLTSEPGNEFFVDTTKGLRENCFMRPGELYWFDHKCPHWAVNGSPNPRMHLIIDAVAPKWRRERVYFQP